ncbi:mandelate racemase/muconate lactonizing enzyme family protein [Pseudomonas chlororaphis]|uniref:mandelate racemase/muconate lactonizing enzyme family protein n=1 Tax=Pseudomonas chlororaphis TaxID=587753 RepID=UPI00046FEC7F|nr:mandelate racemase/muconate lactonizing enzyme family protein [Pseudomonas chlororaphis]
MKIAEIKAYPLSFRVDPEKGVNLGLGKTIKRDTVVVKVTTEDGIVGWGESHHGRAPGAVAHLVNTTLCELLRGYDARETVKAWSRIYKMQISSHGMGTATAIAMSGIDTALWDIKAKVANMPLYRLLGGSAAGIDAYAGGISLGFQHPGQLVEEVRLLVEQGYRAVKLRVGDTPTNDLMRVAAVRKAFGNELEILVDANTAYTLNDVRKVMPGYAELNVGWLEEPFSPSDAYNYAQAKSLGNVPLAAGENHYTRYEFTRLIEDRSITILQPDVSKTGGISEVMRIAALASAWKIPINPHTCTTGLNMAATIHLLASIDNAGYFEGDVAIENPFRTQLTSLPYEVDAAGKVHPLERPGLGIEVDEGFIAAHPLIDGPCFV